MSEYTKGPWFNKGYEIHAEGCCIEIAKVTVFNQSKANANIIASAPDMLEALEATNKELESVILKLNSLLKMDACSSDLDEPDYHDMQTCHENQLLIAKAKGESK